MRFQNKQKGFTRTPSFVSSKTCTKGARQNLVCGFTLLELIVSLGIFTIVMLIAVSTMLSVVSSSRKARSQQLLMDNLHFAVDSMVRNIRVGTNYHCTSTGGYHVPKDCLSGAVIMAFEGSQGDFSNNNDQIAYWRDPSSNSIKISRDSAQNWSELTSPGVVVELLRFYVEGSGKTNDVQPKVRIVVRGYVQIDARTKSNFDIQTLVSQRILDE